jgi:hypothetical protein
VVAKEWSNAEECMPALRGCGFAHKVCAMIAAVTSMPKASSSAVNGCLRPILLGQLFGEREKEIC